MMNKELMSSHKVSSSYDASTGNDTSKLKIYRTIATSYMALASFIPLYCQANMILFYYHYWAFYLTLASFSLLTYCSYTSYNQTIDYCVSLLFQTAFAV